MKIWYYIDIKRERARSPLQERKRPRVGSDKPLHKGDYIMTIQSLTSNETYETTLDSCTCKGFTHWGHCKHNEALKLAYQRARAATFSELWERYDERSETRRCYYEMSLGV
jgi:hypothetical protein